MPTDFLFLFMILVYPSPILFHFYFFIRSELVRVDPSWSDPDWRSKLIRPDFCTCLLLSLTERPIVKTTNIIVITLTLLRPRIGLWRFSIFDTPDGAEPYSHSSNISRKEEWGAITVRGASEGDASLPLILILWKPKTNRSDRMMAGRQFFSFLKLKRNHNF